MGKKIPATYIGEHEVTLSKYGGPYFDGNGQQLLDLNLRKGHVVMMPEEEVLGFTLLHDRTGNSDPINLGVGKVVLPQDQGKADDELMAMGYQFHQGRSDFRAVPPVVDNAPAKRKKDGE